MKFKTKVDWWLQLIFATLLLVNIWAVVALLVDGSGDIIIAAVFTPLNVFLVLPIWLNTYYLLDREDLLIRSGLIIRTRISYSQITSVSGTRNPMNSAALSLDRLEIRYTAKSGKFSKSILISPKDKTGFIEALRNKAENIEVSDEKKPMSKSAKIALAVAGIIPAIIILGIPVLFAVGLREPDVIIHSDNIEIRAMYGVSVDFSNITDISLIDQSMREIGAGRRVNGFNGGTWRGHFTTGLLFVTPDSSPTIRIERNHGSTIYISFRDSGQTIVLYNELSLLGMAIPAMQ